MTASDAAAPQATPPDPSALKAAGAGDPSVGIERAVAELQEAMLARRQVVEDLHATSPKRREQASVRHERELQRIRELMQQTVAAAHARHESLANEATQRRDSVIAESQIEFDADFERVKSFHQEEYTRLKRKLEETVLMAEAWREAGEEAERAKAREFQERMKRFGEEGDEIERQAAEFLEDSGLRAPKFVAIAQSGSSGKPAEVELLQALTSAREALDVIRSGRSSRLLNGVAPYALGAAIVVGAGVIGGATTLLHNKPWLMSAGVSAGGSLVFVAAALVVLKVTAHRSLRSTWAPFQAAIGAFRSAHARALSEDETKREERLRKLRDREAEQEAEAHANLDGPIAEVPKAREKHEKKIRSKHERNVTRAREECDAAIKDSATQRDADIAQAIAGAESALKNEKARFTAEIGVLDAETIRALAEARTCWIRSATRSRELLIAASELDRATQPPLEQLAVENCVAARRADWFRFGTLRLEPATQPGGVPSEPEFAVDLPDAFEFPACLGFPRKGNLIIETTPQTRGAALRIVQAAVTRIVTSIPPSKVRFTFIDPVALGESFASFMHLGDEFEHLVGERIWTEPRAIEQRLQDVSEHMETVIQKYLRNEFEDIDAYNTAAGEIAEPYRFVVCSDFPAAFSDQASARLVSLLRAGQRCGVHVILMLDRAAQLPTGVTREELMSGAAVLAPSRERPGSFEFASGPFAKLPLRLDAPVPDDRLLPILTQIGRAARDASRVEVPFDMIAPSGDAFWSLSSATGLRVPIGRAGATRLQQFALGSGTSQHALIAGKTGSGKSTLLHAIITGLACWYSPAEVELWLVDFKKGVEFKTYAENALPHARAVAIESDREFGLSVLEGLDAELARRGELFREAGVQDIASFRRARPDVRMPRVLLVIDEFQEFFLDDDRVAQSASMLLDRLVRQGRAFGMHALLGSQTLGGAYSLARSTMGQMGVRIALQCNEADSQLILSDENLAARLLSRPGEAIYNDAGGRIEGNSPFQVAFLPDEKRDTWLENVAGRASGRFDSLPRIVFEGDARAPMKLSPAARGGVAPDPRGSVRLWVGEAVAIKDPTCARLARTSGANVATISSRDDQSLGTSIAMLLSIAREAPGATIDVFDGTPADVPEYGRLAQVAESNGIAVRFTPYREIDQRLLEIADDVASRGDDSSRPRRFLLIHQIQRYRALRRSEDDFSFGASDAPPGPDKLLVGIIKEGPAAGVHVIVACDSLASLQRSFDRTTLREFDWKVLFQMSPSDSSTIIDSPAASRLGNNRGLLHSEELGMVEKFRPYV